MSLSKLFSSIALSLTFLSLFVVTSFAQTPVPTRNQNKLNEVKMKLCEGFEDKMASRMDRLERFFDNMIEKFDSIAMRVDKFYIDKVLPDKTVPNYNALVADIAGKKAIAQTSLEKAKDNGDQFSCDADSPRNKLLTYRTDMQKVKQDLKNYRTSIKNLIVAVHSVAGEDNKLTPTESE